jgi:hypothetical protein
LIYRIDIPRCYVWMTRDSVDRAALFRRYVIGYLKVTHPELQLVRISGMVAECRLKTDEVTQALT